jgi:hypothetical protein
MKAMTLILAPVVFLLLLDLPATASAQETQSTKTVKAPLDLSGDTEDLDFGVKEFSPYLDSPLPAAWNGDQSMMKRLL